MRINQLLDLNISSLSDQVSYTDLQEQFSDSSLQYVVILYDTGELLGTITREQFQAIEDSEQFDLSNLVDNLHLFDYYHILEALREFMKSGKEHLPVLDDNGFYVGFCHVQDVLYHYTRTMGIVEAGSMLVLQTTIQNYSLIDIAKIVESNQAKVLHLYVNSHPDSTQLEITMLLNVSEINDIISTFNRFDYQVNYSSYSSSQKDFIKERYDSFMHFLEI